MTVKAQLPALDLFADTYGLAQTCAESEVGLGEWTYFVLQKAGRRPVLYLYTALSLESYVMKKAKTCCRCVRARTARLAGRLVQDMWNNRKSAPRTR